MQWLACLMEWLHFFDNLETLFCSFEVSDDLRTTLLRPYLNDHARNLFDPRVLLITKAWRNSCSTNFIWVLRFIWNALTRQCELTMSVLTMNVLPMKFMFYTVQNWNHCWNTISRVAKLSQAMSIVSTCELFINFGSYQKYNVWSHVEIHFSYRM